MQAYKALNLSLSILTLPCLGLDEKTPSSTDSVNPQSAAAQISNKAASSPQAVKQARYNLDNLLQEFNILNSKTSLDWMKKEISSLIDQSEQTKKNLKDSSPVPDKILTSLQLKKHLISEFIYQYSELQAMPGHFQQLLRGESENGSDFNLSDFKVSQKTQSEIAAQSAQINSTLELLSAGPKSVPFDKWISESNNKLSELNSSAAELAKDLDSLEFRKKDHSELTLEKVREIVKLAPWLIGGTALLYFGFVVIRELNKAFRNSTERLQVKSRMGLSSAKEAARLKQAQSRHFPQ